jgi:hypothetical protein
MKKNIIVALFAFLFITSLSFFVIEDGVSKNQIIKVNDELNLTSLARELNESYLLTDDVTKVREVMNLGRFLSTRADSGMSLITSLEKQGSEYSGPLSAELLFYYAAGDNQWRRKNHVFKGLIPTVLVCEKAANYLHHPDPFTRAMAEWAISTRVNWEANLSLADPEKYINESWYREWISSRTTERILENDYFRQAWALGIYRSPSALLRDAGEIMKRTLKMATEFPDSENNKKLKDLENELSNIYSQFQVDYRDNEISLAGAQDYWLQMRLLSRSIIMNNPDLDFGETVFSTRHANHSGENITNGAKTYINKPGGDICVKKGFDPGSGLTNLIKGRLGPGHTKGIDLWWDADRIVFSWVKQPDYFKDTIHESDQGFDDYMHGASGPAALYEISLRGKKIQKITQQDYNADIEPTYLPNGDIVFSSSRGDFGSQCSGHFFQNKKIVNLYRTSPDGQNIRAISNNKDFDRYAHTMDNGLVLYTRWEYQERHLWQTHNLWTARPDGSMSEAIFKQHINNGPMSLRDARSIPGSEKLVAIGCGHHEWAQGAVFIIDYQKGINENDGFRCVTPFITNREGGLGDKKIVEQGGVVDSFGVYQQPFALSQKSFLVSYSWFIPRKVFNATNFGIYYIDVYGNKELIHLEPVLSSIYPMPLVKREKPPVVPDVYNEQQNFASIYVTDIYEGLPEVERGEIKYIRISHHTEWPTIHTGDDVLDYNHLHYTPSGSWARSLGLWTWSPARTFGVVPVYEDGSAYFKSPVGIPVYFQALDENYLEVRRMRTFVSLQAGETRGCTGCHESRDEAPVSLSHIPAALAYEPSVPVPPAWGETVLPDFEKHIQPIFDRNCVSCHNKDKMKGGLDFSSRQIDYYNQSYRSLFGLKPGDPTPVQEGWSRKLMYPELEHVVNDRPSLELMENNEYPGQLIAISNRFSDNSVTRVREFGSAESKLIQVLLRDRHKGYVNMNEEDWVSLVTWIDLNAPYWGSFVDKEPVREGQRPERVFVTYPEAFSSEPYSFEVTIKMEEN